MDGLTRKQRTEAKLKSVGVPVNDWLPRTTDESEVGLRPAREVARRIMALCAVGAVASGLPRTEVDGWLEAEGLWSALSPLEAEFLRADNPSPEEEAAFSWRLEAMWPLLWCLGLVRELGWPGDECDVRHMISLIPEFGEPTGPFVERAALRPLPEILDESDLIFRIHWAVREQQLKRRAPLPGLHPAVVYQRHYALNWVTGDEPWDEVNTST